MTERGPSQTDPPQGDDFEFDFFDEPDEETVTQRRSAVGPRRAPKPPRGPVRPPAGLTPISLDDFATREALVR